MTRRYCDGCDRDISHDENYVHLSLQANLDEMLKGRRPLAPRAFDYCMKCAELRLDVTTWRMLQDEPQK